VRTLTGVTDLWSAAPSGAVRDGTSVAILAAVLAGASSAVDGTLTEAAPLGTVSPSGGAGTPPPAPPVPGSPDAGGHLLARLGATMSSRSGRPPRPRADVRGPGHGRPHRFHATRGGRFQPDAGHCSHDIAVTADRWGERR
jgi:hypothetical protein